MPATERETLSALPSSSDENPLMASAQARAAKKSSGGPQRRQQDSIPPEIALLLAEPEVRLLMRADGVDESELLKTLHSVAAQLRKNAARAERGRDTGRGPARRSNANYRPGVGIMLLNTRGQIFVGRRIDMKEDAWQMPQGGINPGEDPRDAAIRELKEEIGTDDAEMIAESKTWLYYDVPEAVAKKAWGGRWQGQRQKWFVMLLKAPDSAIEIATEHPEFDDWRWVSLQELSGLAVSFKRQLYVNVMGEFATIFRD